MTVARFRNRSSLHPINRIKHVVDSSGTLTAGTTVSEILIQENAAPVIANTNEVITGSKVNGIYLKVEVASNETDAGAIPNVYMAILKDPSDLAGNIDPTSIGANTQKNLVIHQEMVMLNNIAGGNPRILFNGVVVIPKGLRRFSPADKLRLQIRSTALNIAYCLQCHYKEFR